jgi:hypothetical protein
MIYWIKKLQAHVSIVSSTTTTPGIEAELCMLLIVCEVVILSMEDTKSRIQRLGDEGNRKREGEKLLSSC